MEDHSFIRWIKSVPGIIAILFILTLFIWLTLGIKHILTPTALTVILIAILLPFQEENKTIKILIAAIVFLYLSWFLSLIASTLTPFLIALILAYIFDPVITYLTKKGFSRTVSILILMAGLILIFIVILLFFLPAVIQEVTGFMEQIPMIEAKLVEYFNMLKHLKDKNVPPQLEWLKKLIEYEIPPDLKDLTDNLLRKAQESIPQVANKIWTFISKTFSNILQFILGLLSLIIIPVFLFYMLKEADIIKAFAVELIPKKNRKDVLEILGDVNIALSNFLRGQLLVASFVGISTAIGLSIIGIKFALLIGLIAGVTNIIPYVGAIIGITPALLLALFTANPLLSVFLVCVVFGVVSFLENSIVSPNILGESINLNPILIMLAIIVGGQLQGFWGMLLAVPCVCILKVLFDRWFKKYKIRNVPPEQVKEEEKIIPAPPPVKEAQNKINKKINPPHAETLLDNKKSRHRKNKKRQ